MMTKAIDERQVTRRFAGILAVAAGLIAALGIAGVATKASGGDPGAPPILFAPASETVAVVPAPVPAVELTSEQSGSGFQLIESPTARAEATVTCSYGAVRSCETPPAESQAVIVVRDPAAETRNVTTPERVTLFERIRSRREARGVSKRRSVGPVRRLISGRSICR